MSDSLIRIDEEFSFNVLLFNAVQYSRYLSYEELGNVHWRALLRLTKASQRF